MASKIKSIYSVYLYKHLMDKIAKEATKRDLSRNQLLNKIMKEWIENK